MRSIRSPRGNRRESAATPAREVLNSWVENPMIIAPVKEALFPKISKKPKNSAERSLGNNLGVVGAGQGLNGTLEHCHTHGQEPEFPGAVQL